MAWRTASSWTIGLDRIGLMPNTTPGLGRDTNVRPDSSRLATSWGGTPPMIATCPDCTAPVRTLDSGMIVKTISST